MCRLTNKNQKLSQQSTICKFPLLTILNARNLKITDTFEIRLNIRNLVPDMIESENNVSSKDDLIVQLFCDLNESSSFLTCFHVLFVRDLQETVVELSRRVRTLDQLNSCLEFELRESFREILELLIARKTFFQISFHVVSDYPVCMSCIELDCEIQRRCIRVDNNHSNCSFVLRILLFQHTKCCETILTIENFTVCRNIDRRHPLSIKKSFEDSIYVSCSQGTIPWNERKMFYVFYEITLLKGSTTRKKIFRHNYNFRYC